MDKVYYITLIHLFIDTKTKNNTDSSNRNKPTFCLQKYKNPDDFKIFHSNNINANGNKDPVAQSNESSNKAKIPNRTGSSLWGKAKAKLGIPNERPR